MKSSINKGMTPARQHALINVRASLGLETANLNKRQDNGLLDRFHSFPMAIRQDGELLADRLEPVDTILQAFGSAETAATVTASPELQRRLHAISARATKLAQG